MRQYVCNSILVMLCRIRYISICDIEKLWAFDKDAFGNHCVKLSRVVKTRRYKGFSSQNDEISSD